MTQLFKIIRADLQHKASWYGLAPNKQSVLRMLVSDGTTAQLLYRCVQFCQQRKLWPIAAILYRLNAVISHIIIGRNADFGPGLVILHSFGTVVNTNVIAGRNLVLENGVTIGAEKRKSPVIGDDVFVGAGAKIIGDVQIGSNVKIGANAVVVSDLPDGATAVGIPARVVRIYGKPVNFNMGLDGRNTHPGLVSTCEVDPDLHPSIVLPVTNEPEQTYVW